MEGRGVASYLCESGAQGKNESREPRLKGDNVSEKSHICSVTKEGGGGGVGGGLYKRVSRYYSWFEFGVCTGGSSGGILITVSANNPESKALATKLGGRPPRSRLQTLTFLATLLSELSLCFWTWRWPCCCGPRCHIALINANISPSFITLFCPFFPHFFLLKQQYFIPNRSMFEFELHLNCIDARVI